MARLRIRRLGHEEEITVVDHLDELRDRLIISLVSLAVAFGFAFWRHQDLIELLRNDVPKGVSKDFLVTGVGEQFSIALTVSFWAAVCVALPVLFYQLYAYVVPAVNPDAQHRLWPVLILVPTLFMAGVVFCYVLVIPAAADFLLNFDKNLYTVLPRAREWYGFCVTLMLVVGLIFELPAAVLMLARLGVVTSAMMRRYRRYAIVVNAVVAAALPGVDPITMLFELLPLLILYELSVWLARLVEPKKARSDSTVGVT